MTMEQQFDKLKVSAKVGIVEMVARFLQVNDDLTGMIEREGRSH